MSWVEAHPSYARGLEAVSAWDRNLVEQAKAARISRPRDARQRGGGKESRPSSAVQHHRARRGPYPDFLRPLLYDAIARGPGLAWSTPIPGLAPRGPRGGGRGEKWRSGSRGQTWRATPRRRTGRTPNRRAPPRAGRRETHAPVPTPARSTRP